MQKIMFSDKFGLTKAVLEGRKTMTRRICSKGAAMEALEFDNWSWAKYHIGEVVAVAQSYHALNKAGFVAPEWCEHTCEDSPGYENKMFVRADLMPHQIRITNVRVERLQDISDEDCLHEGIIDLAPEYKKKHGTIESHYCFGESFKFQTPRLAFSALINALNGRGTWERNEWQFAYTFRLIK